MDELRKSMPIDVEALNAVPGLGPKKLMLLYKKLKVRNIEDLRKAAEQHKIMKLPGFGEKSEMEILKSITADGKEKERVPLEKALPAANEIVRLLRRLPEAQKVEAAGSIRRKRETIGDIDILVASEQPEAVSKVFVSMPLVQKVLASGETKSSVVLRGGMQADLRVVKPLQWGSALQYFTGSKAHSIELRKIAIKKGLKLSEYGVFRGSKVVASKTEEDVYNALGLDYIPPEERENEGEIEAAMKKFVEKKKQ
ncbi:MAG: helix-hairpin-helix domain-containing protein [Candidatus Diapherotrites archaeon]|nr:helix-hairpin-helix domain-containing protein [Candidatus Diapherotrites archaeon]